MTDSCYCTIVAEAWRRELMEIGQAIMHAESVAALRRIDRLLDELEGLKRAQPSIACGALGWDGH